MELLQKLQTNQEDGTVSRLRAAWPFWCFVLLLLLSLVFILTDIFPQRDVACRYAPMADAFRDRDFTYAFHPRTGFLHSFTSGLIALVLNCDGFLACKISSLLFMSLGIFPLYGVMRRVYSRSMAEITTFAFVLGSQLQRLAWSGLRDSHKSFLVLLAGYALVLIYQERRSWAGYIWLAAAAGLGIVTRGDLVLFMSLIFLWGITMEMKLKSFPWRGLCACILTVLLVMPSILLNWYFAGVAVPEIRFAWIFRKILHRYPGLNDILLLIGLGIVLAFLFAWLIYRIYDAGYGKVLFWIVLAGVSAAVVRCFFLPDFYLEISIWDYLWSIVQGFFPVFAFTAVFGIGYRILLKKWTEEESILAAVLFGHALLVCLQIIFNDGYLYVSSRYLVPAMPLELGWSVLGVMSLWVFLTGWLAKDHPVLVRSLGYTAFILTVCGFIIDFYVPLFDYVKTKGRKYRAEVNHLVSVIRNDYQGPAEFRPEVCPDYYISKRNPAIGYVAYRENKKTMDMTSDRIIVSAYLIGGRPARNLKEAHYVIEKYSEKNPIPADWQLLETVKLKKHQYRIWKKSR